MTSYELTHSKKMVRVWKTRSLLFCLRYDPLIVFRRQNHVTFIFIKTMSHDLVVQMAYQKHYPHLGSDTSSVWNFCARFSDVFWRENRWWRRQMCAPYFWSVRGNVQWNYVKSFTKFDWSVIFSCRSKYGACKNKYSIASDKEFHVSWVSHYI